MEVQIISKQIVKPSCSTPEHRRTHKLSLLDQLAPPVYIPITLFYSSNGENSFQQSDHLKASFSQILTHFYPFAGRVKDSFSVDCNDEGAMYVVAHVAGDMIVFLEEPEIYLLEKLLPCNPHDVSAEVSSQVILAAQVNHFDCGGMAISICIWHAMADASAVASFLTSWAAVARGFAGDFHGVNFGCTSIFPPEDIRGFSLHRFVKEDLLSNISMKRFVFDGFKVAALRGEVGTGSHLDPPTRFEAVASLIWGAVMTINTKEEVESTATTNAATIAVGLRKRMIPEFPQLSIGNIYQVAMANCSNNENMLDYNGLARKLHDSVGKMTNDFVRKIHSGGGYFQFLRKKGEELGKNPNLMRIFGFSSWCRFPFYEADFGWGKPSWVGTALKLYKVAIFIDTKDGQGIEAWVSLPKEDMAKFEHNPGICAYASFKPTT